MLNVGDKAPDFELKDQDGKNVKLSTFHGRKVLLAFFPFAFSPVCTEEMKCFENDLDEFKNKGIEIVGVSVDSGWSNKAFSDKLGLNFPLLSDFNKEVSKKYGVLRPEGFSERAYFVIDEKGLIKFRHVMESPGKKLDNGELLKVLD